MLHPHIGAVGVLAVDMHHGGVSPPGHTFFGKNARNRCVVALQEVALERPRTGGGHAFVLEVVDLDKGIVPVAAHQLALTAQQIQRSGILILIQLIGRGNPKIGPMRHQIKRSISNMDRPVIGLHAALVAFAVRQGLLFKHHRPGCWRHVAKHLGVVHQDVRPPHVRRAIMRAVDKMPGGLFQTVIDGVPAWDKAGVDRLHALARNHAQTCVTRRSHQVKTALVHQRDHLVGGVGRLHVDHAPRLIFEAGNPVEGLHRLAALNVARPCHNVQLTLARAKFCYHLSCKRLSHHGRHNPDCGSRIQHALHRTNSLFHISGQNK